MDQYRYVLTSTCISIVFFRQFSGSVRNKLFNTLLDLTSLNIQRGRDHGLPSYTEWRKACGLSVPSSGDAWSEMTYIRGGTRDLRDLYAYVLVYDNLEMFIHFFDRPFYIFCRFGDLHLNHNTIYMNIDIFLTFATG